MMRSFFSLVPLLRNYIREIITIKVRKYYREIITIKVIKVLPRNENVYYPLQLIHIELPHVMYVQPAHTNTHHT